MPRDVESKPQRRSPIKKPPLRTAGQSLREQMFDLLFDRWLSYVLALAVVWLLVLLDWFRLALRVPWSWKSCLALTSFAAAFSLLAFFRMRGTHARLKNLRLGLDGEVAVGQFLDEYCRERGYKVLHDLQGDGFNVDHVLIGPGGIFAIDTKTHSKPSMGDRVITYDGQSVLIDGHPPDRDPIKQAKASARFVA